MKKNCTELKINILRPREGKCQIELRFSNPGSDAESTPMRTTCPLNPQELLPLQLDSAGYGKALADQLFHEPEALAFYREIRAVTEATDQVLRVRLRADNAPDLHALRWELLVDPVTGRPLATSENILFSRFMKGPTFRYVRLQPRAELRALVAVANPVNVNDYNDLAPVDLDGEIKRARNSLNGITVETAGKERPLTLPVLDQCLRKGFDILYLVCHGMLRTDGPRLCLQKEDGTASWESGEKLAHRISDMRQPPRLVVLASCQSAGTGRQIVAGDENSLPQVALAQHLATAGVPAIIAMQGNISMTTVETMMPVFFGELLEDGRIDRAMAVARGAVQERPDFWMPALFLRLRLGCIWDESEGLVKGNEDNQPGFGRGDRWKARGNAVWKKIGQCGHDIKRLRTPFSLGLIAALLAGLVIYFVKYPHQVSKMPLVNKSTDAQQQIISKKNFDSPGDSEAEIKTVSTPESKIEAHDTMTDPITGMEFVSVPGGCFLMGSPDNEEGRNHREGPRHEVCVDGFQMGKYEVTQGQWVKIMGGMEGHQCQFRMGDEYPMEKVSWDEVQEFIVELNKQSKQSGREYRLPTEAEWEYAVRARTTTARYWGDDIFCSQAMYSNSKGNGNDSCMEYTRSEEAPAALTPYSTAPVGSYPHNQFGLYDMLGNVAEFCSNWLGPYPLKKRNPQGPTKGDYRVFRGGGLGSSDSWVRSAARYGLPPHERNYGIGFRLVLPGL